MLNMFKRFWTWLKSWVLEKEETNEKPDPKEVPLYLACNGMYMALIESLERQIQQVEIDLAIGSIDKETYDQHFVDFQNQVKKLSADYARELLLYSA